jgi:recombination protein RecA
MLLHSKAIGLIIVDSVAALTPRAEIDGEMGDSKMGLHARLMSQAMRKLTGIVSKSGCTLIFINQTRMKIGIMFGNPTTTTGGEALKFYSSVRLEVSRSTQLKDGEGDAAGNKTKVKVVKNKVAPPFKTAEFDILYGQGISRIGEVVDFATELEIIQKSGSWFSYDGTKLGQGRDNVMQIMSDNPELLEQIEQKINDVINP